MKLTLTYRLNEIVPEIEKEPAWSSQIKRWTQLDASSYIVAEATFRHLDFIKAKEIDQLILLSSQGSFETDCLFAHSSKFSPAHFVHTLPNVRSLAFSQISNWEGVMFCLSQGIHSLLNFFYEALLAHYLQNTLILNLNKKEENYQCDFYHLCPFLNEKQCYLEINTHVQKEEEKRSFFVDDFQFRDFLHVKSQLPLSPALTLRNIIGK